MRLLAVLSKDLRTFPLAGSIRHRMTIGFRQQSHRDKTSDKIGRFEKEPKETGARRLSGRWCYLPADTNLASSACLPSVHECRQSFMASRGCLNQAKLAACGGRFSPIA